MAGLPLAGKGVQRPGRLRYAASFASAENVARSPSRRSAISWSTNRHRRFAGVDENGHAFGHPVGRQPTDLYGASGVKVFLIEFGGCRNRVSRIGYSRRVSRDHSRAADRLLTILRGRVR